MNFTDLGWAYMASRPSLSKSINFHQVGDIAKQKITCDSQIFFDMAHWSKSQIPDNERDLNIFWTVFQNNVADQKGMIMYS